MPRDQGNPTRISLLLVENFRNTNAKNSSAAIFSWFAGSFRFDGCFPGMLGLCLQQGVPNTCKLAFIAKEGEDGKNQQHQLPQDELRSPPMIKHGHPRQRADE